MERSTIKVETLDPLVADESIHDSAGNDLTDVAPCCSRTNLEDATELKPEGLMNSSVKLGINDKIWNEKSENSPIGPSLRMMSNLVVIAPQDDNFDKYEHFQTNRIPYSPDHQQDINQDPTGPAVKQEIIDVVLKEEKSEDVLMEDIHDKQARGEIQNYEDHIKLEDINCPWVDNLKEKDKREAQPVVMKNEMPEYRLPEDMIRSERINGDLSDDQMSKLPFSENVHKRFRPVTSTVTSDDGSDKDKSCSLSSGEELDEKKKVKPPTCDNSFSTPSALQYHQTTWEKPYGCTMCDRSFKGLSALKYHQRTHTGEKPYECTTCDKSFRCGRALQFHQRTHTGEKRHRCTTCDKSFKTLTSLKYHQRTHTGEKPYECTTCNKSYKGLSALKYHQRTHTGEKPYACTTCDKSFRCGRALQYHQRTHTGEKPYTCTTCDKSFRSTIHLRTHQRTHTGEGLFPCEICNKSFTHPIPLHNHMITHQNLKLFSCPECDKVFPNESSLKIHSWTHTDEKPYQCNTCDKSFKDPYSFKAHHRKHTLSGEKP